MKVKYEWSPEWPESRTHDGTSLIYNLDVGPDFFPPVGMVLSFEKSRPSTEDSKEGSKDLWLKIVDVTDYWDISGLRERIIKLSPCFNSRWDSQLITLSVHEEAVAASCLHSYYQWKWE